MNINFSVSTSFSLHLTCFWTQNLEKKPFQHYNFLSFKSSTHIYMVSFFGMYHIQKILMYSQCIILFLTEKFIHRRFTLDWKFSFCFTMIHTTCNRLWIQNYVAENILLQTCSMLTSARTHLFRLIYEYIFIKWGN